jgi:conjugative relaxase-like TrwC/TraI family protein
MVLSFAVGHSVAYLLGPIAQGREGYFLNAVQAGEPAGQWWGAGAEALGLRGEVDADVMEAIYAHFRDPTDPLAQSRETWENARVLGRAARTNKTPTAHFREMLAREPGASPERREEMQREADALARNTVMFFDMTFSPGKDVTVSWVAFERAANDARAMGDERAGEAWAEHARAVERAVMMGARASLEFLQDEAGYSRVGRHGGSSRTGRWVDAHALVVAQFLQHDSREKDPQLHVHQAILNKALGADGKWYGVDGDALSMLKGAAGAIGERVMQAELTRTLGLRFETRPDGKARQIVGVDQRVMDMFSKRTQALSPRAERACREFAEYHGREPNGLERAYIRQQATLATRQAKSHAQEPRGERLDRWDRECRGALAGGLAQVARNALQAGAEGHGRTAERFDPQAVMERAVARVAEKRPTWTRGDLMRAVSDVLPANLGLPPEKMRPLLESLADKALADVVRVTPEERTEDLPASMLLQNGRSPYQRPAAVKFTSQGQVAAEHALRRAAVERGAARMTDAEAQAVVARFAENGVELGADQRAAVLGVLTSGAMLERIEAPAGAGKSWTVGTIADAWRGTGRNLYGLASGQAQADILTAERIPSWNITAWLGGRDVPALQAGDIVVVDEAGMASTADLAAVSARCRAAGAKLVLVGDSKQLGSVGAGGAFADLSTRSLSYELTEVRRFHEDWEKTASLGLRERDRAAVDEYDRHGRIRAGGTQEQAAEAAARAWLADTVAGKESLLVVGSNAAAYAVSAQLRTELVRLGMVEDAGAHLGMDGNTAGVGDLVQARHNAWNLRGWEGNERCPINRQAYRVLGMREDGGLSVEPAAGGPRMELPAAYVQEHLTLAYASTVHAAEGRTVDTGHGVIDAATGADAAYVMATRGRGSNTMWVVTQRTNQDAPVGEAQDVAHRTAKGVLTDILERAQDMRGALQEKADEEEKAASMLTAVERLADEAQAALAGRTSRMLDMAAATGAITEEQRAALAADPAMVGLDRVLRQAEVAGRDPADVLSRALQGRSLDSATSPAAVLHHRIRESVDLAPRLRSAHDLVPHGLPEDVHARLSRLAEDADERRRELGSRVAEERPAWAVQAMGPVPEDAMERQEWEASAAWAAASRELGEYTDAEEALPAAPPAGLVEKHAFWRTAHVELDLPDRSPEEAQLSDGALRNRVAAFDRERVWAPRWVGDELSATAEEENRRRTDAGLWAERAEREDLPAVERDQLRRAAEEAAREAAELAEKRALLEEADRARTQWWLHTATTRDHAARAKVELGSRGVALDDPGDTVTADEWLEAEAEARADDDAHRAINEHDMADEEVRADERVAEPAVEVSEDIRERTVADASEFADTPPVRAVPTYEDARAAVDRAREALLEIEARKADDAAHEQMEWQAAQDTSAQEDAAVRVRG